jgi:hypothetical protein
MARRGGWFERDVVLASGHRVRDAPQRFTHVDVADTAVLVDAGPNVVDAALGELVRQIRIGEELASHRDEVGLAVGDDAIGLVGFEAPERDHRHVHA